MCKVLLLSACTAHNDTYWKYKKTIITVYRPWKHIGYKSRCNMIWSHILLLATWSRLEQTVLNYILFFFYFFDGDRSKNFAPKCTKVKIQWYIDVCTPTDRKSDNLLKIFNGDKCIWKFPCRIAKAQGDMYVLWYCRCSCRSRGATFTAYENLHSLPTTNVYLMSVDHDIKAVVQWYWRTFVTERVLTWRSPGYLIFTLVNCWFSNNDYCKQTPQGRDRVPC